MEFEWDDSKNSSNIAKHGIDFHDAIAIFLDVDRIEWEDKRKNYGEKRYITIGMKDDTFHTVVYTWRLKYRRIISARISSYAERKTYQSYLKTRE